MASTGPRRPPREPRQPRAPRARSSRGRPAKTPLSEEAVIAAGLKVLEVEGLDAVTMRRVARELDTGAASLYVYVDNRDELLRMMFDRVAAEIPRETPDAARWRDQVHDLCVNMLAVLESYPGIARVALAEIPMGLNALDSAETLVGLLIAGGIDPQSAAFGADALFLIVTANAVETVISQERADADTFDIEAFREAFRQQFSTLPPDRFPQLSKHAAVMVAGDKDERFAFSIDVFIEGLVALAARRR
jgi:AcrR family transcriptional regulator